MMHDFIANQVLSLNGLVNLSNLVFLLAFSLRDVFYLRILSVAAYFVILPYYYLQQETLWPPIFWGIVFILVNLVRVAMLLWERRPVVLSGEEENLYQLAFGSMDKREFIKLMGLAEWQDCRPGEVIVKKGKSVGNLMIMTTGEINATITGNEMIDIRPGQIIGTLEVFGNLQSPIDIIVRQPSRLVRWNISRVQEFAASRPDLRAKLVSILNDDLAGKLRQMPDLLMQVNKFAK
jgi:CRP-like cAMP-binding protein